MCFTNIMLFDHMTHRSGVSLKITGSLFSLVSLEVTSSYPLSKFFLTIVIDSIKFEK